jgi:hypothetical protein
MPRFCTVLQPRQLLTQHHLRDARAQLLDSHVASAAVAGFPSSAAARIAVVGRQKS